MAARVRFRALELFNNSVWYLLAFLERNVRKTLEQLLLQRGASWTFWCPHQRWPYFQQSEHAGIGSRKEGSARLSSLSPLSIMRKENTLRPARDCVFNNMTWPVSQKTGPMGNVTRTKKSTVVIFTFQGCQMSRQQISIWGAIVSFSVLRGAVSRLFESMMEYMESRDDGCAFASFGVTDEMPSKQRQTDQGSSYSFAETHQRFGTSKDIPCRGPHLWLYESQQVKNWESRIFEGKLDDSWYDPQKLVSVAIIVRFWGRGLSLVYAREVIRSPPFSAECGASWEACCMPLSLQATEMHGADWCEAAGQSEPGALHSQEGFLESSDRLHNSTSIGHFAKF